MSERAVDPGEGPADLDRIVAATFADAGRPGGAAATMAPLASDQVHPGGGPPCGAPDHRALLAGLVSLVDDTVANRVYRAALRGGVAEDIAIALVADAKLAESEREGICNGGALMLAKYAPQLSYGPEIIFGSAVLSYVLRVRGTLTDLARLVKQTAVPNASPG